MICPVDEVIDRATSRLPSLAFLLIIRVNLFYPQPSLHVSFIKTSLVFFFLSKLLFTGFLHFKVNFVHGQIIQNVAGVKNFAD